MNFGVLTLVPDYVSDLRRMRHNARQADLNQKLAEGKKVRTKLPPLTGRPTWKIETQPHIGMQIKRLFPGVVGTPKVMYYTHTPEAARNLAWLMVRFPMKVYPAKALFDTAASHKEREQRVFDIMSGKVKLEETVGPIPLARPLWPQQVTGVELLMQRRHLIIADGTGEGKTAQAIAAMARMGGMSVVGTLTSLPIQWKHAVEDWTSGGLKVHIVDSGIPYDMANREIPWRRRPVSGGRQPDVVLISYSKLYGWAETLAPRVKLAVWDEVQEFRTGTESARWDAGYVISTAADYVLGLSATPIYNYGPEFWNVAELVSPGELGTQEEFDETWCVTREGKKVVSDPVAFGTYLYESGLMIRRNRPKAAPQIMVHWVETNRDAMNSATASLDALAREILAQKETKRGEKMMASGQFEMWMRQACGIDKAPFVAEFVKLLLQTEERVVLYGHHKAVYKIWMKELAEFNPVMYTGDESPAEKDYSMIRFAGASAGLRKEAYVGGDSRVFLCANRAGAGLDGLQHVCRCTVHGELDWSKGVMTQNVGRVDREGQLRTVLAYIMMSDTIPDHKLLAVNGIKGQQFDGIMDPKRGLIEDLQRDSGYIKEMAQEYLRGRGISA